MVTLKNKLVLIIFVFFAVLPGVLSAQGNLMGKWKYSSPEGEMIMEINNSNVVINNESYPCKIENNNLQILENNVYTPYPYRLSGNQLILIFPGGMEVIFVREAGSPTGPIKLPQSAQKAPGGQSPQSSTSLIGQWVFQTQEGQVMLEFSSSNQLTFNGESTQYQLKPGVIQAMGDYGWIDYPYTLSQGVLSITFPEGTVVPFKKASSSASTSPYSSGQQGAGGQTQGGNLNWQLQGSLCFWSGSSGGYGNSSYSRSEKISFDGNGNFIFGNESSFTGDAGMAYGGNPNAEGGTYRVEKQFVILRFRSGETIQAKISVRQNNGKITCLDYNGKLYAVELCD